MTMMDEICCCGAKMSPLASTIGPSVKPVNISSTVPASSSNANLATVTVPDGMVPGQTLMIRYIGGSGDGQMISAIIPEGHFPGQKFDVRLPSSSVGSVGQLGGDIHALSPDVVGSGHRQHPATSKVVSSQQQGKAYKRCSEESLMLHNKGLVKIKVPPGRTSGDRFRVQIPDGRTIDVVVPAGIIDEFHVKVPPKKQNFHDNPIAVHAPMLLGPMLL